MPKPKSGIKRGGGKGTTQAAKTGREETVRGVLQSEIDKLRGTRDHQSPDSITWKDVQAQYAKVGINITDQQAQEIHHAVLSFSGNGYTPMRTAMSKSQKGIQLTEQEQKYLAQYKLCEEWCKVAPVFASSKHSIIYRGISGGYNPNTEAYAQKIKALKVGETLNLDHMPSSFSTELHTAKAFAGGKNGIIIHTPVSSLKNSTSIKGMSYHSGENEVLVADYGSKIIKINDQTTNGDGYYHIYVQ